MAAGPLACYLYINMGINKYVFLDDINIDQNSM
jgi:hypothetical protein